MGEIPMFFQKYTFSKNFINFFKILKKVTPTSRNFLTKKEFFEV